MKAVDHIAIAIWSIEEALVLFRDLLGGEFLMGGDDEELGIRTVQLRLSPGVKIELLQPTGNAPSAEIRLRRPHT